VLTEYVEFFRTKNKFTREWRKNIAHSEEMVNQAKKELKRYEAKLVTLMQVQPMVLECIHLMSNYAAADLTARKDLSDLLRLQNYASDGYLIVDKMATDHQRPTSTKLSQTLSQARAKLGLYALTLDHRGSGLDYREYT
jgi:hypothetical protein